MDPRQNTRDIWFAYVLSNAPARDMQELRWKAEAILELVAKVESDIAEFERDEE